MATHLLSRFSWIFFAVLMLASLGSPQAVAQSCPTGSERTYTHVSCPGANDGTATVRVIGGVPNYVYILQKRVGIASYTNTQVSPEVSDTTYTFTGIEPGSYRIEIYDSQVESCYALYTEGFVVGTTGTTPPNIDISGPTEVCEGQTSVSYSVPLTGGSSYSWSVPADATIVSGASGPENNTIIVNFGSLSGQIKVTETNSGGCSGNEASLNVTVIPTPEQYTLTVAGATTFCEGSSGPTLGLSGSDVGITYTLLRDGNAVATVEGNGSAISFGAHNISGTYTAMAYVTASSSCTATMDGSVVLDATTAPTLTLTPSHASCAGSADGSIDLTIDGGTGPFEIEWSTGATTEDISGLAAGNYTVTVTDASRCSVEASVEITQPDALSLSAVVTQVNCNGAQDGSIDLSVAGGTAPYTYRWGHGPTTQDVTGLDIGTYSVTVTDANNCTAIQEYEITEPAALRATAVVAQQVSCFGGSDGAIDLSVTGGVAPYTYDWGNGITVEDPANLVAGVYRVLVTDGNNCTTTAEATVTEPAAIEASFTVNDAATCGGSEGSIDLSVSGGTAPYTYRWADGQTTEDISGLSAGTYAVTITDNNGCELEASATVAQPAGISSLEGVLTHVSCFGGNNGAIDLTVNGGTAPYTYRWEHGPTTEDLTGLAAGTYVLTVTDAANCEATESFTITQPAALEASAVLTHVACAGTNSGAIDITVSGGTGSYTYAWSNGATTEDISGLAAGDYTVLIRDENGCTLSAAYTINDGITITLNETIEPVSCNGGSDGAISLEVNGGTAPYTYSWSNGATTEDLTGLVAGTYRIEVMDATGCVASENFTVTQPEAISLTAQVQNTSACNAADGAIDLTVSGGTAPYTYSWSNGATTEDLLNLVAGVYSVVVTDANGCTETGNYTINDADGPALDVVVTHAACHGSATGAIDLTVTGGTAPYSYSWSTGATTEDLNELTADTYSVSVTDANGCTSALTAVVQEPEVLTADATAASISCQGEADGSINLTVSGGVAPYQYQWTKDGVAITADTEDLHNLDAGTYEVTVTDANGCSVGASATVSEPAALQASISGTTSLCAGDTNGSLEASASGGTGSYSYLWNTGATTAAIDGLTAGTYEVSVTDANSCTTMVSFTISEEQVVVNLGPDQSACAPASIELLSGYSTDTHDIRWSTGEASASIVVSATGIYSVTITDRSSGCSGTDDVLVEIENGFEPAVSIAPVEEITCNSEQIVLNASVTYGGEAPRFQWYRNGDAIGGATEQQYEVGVFNNGDNFSVEVTSSLSCADPQVVYAEYQLILPQVEAPQLSASEAVVCQGGDMPIITETTGGTMRWYYDAANPTNPRIDRSLIIYEGTAFAPSAADYGVGTHNFLVTQTTVHCGESMDWATFALFMTEETCEVPVCEVAPSVLVRVLPGSEICPDIRTLTLEADTTDIGENPQYAWYYNGTLFSSEAAPSYTSTEGFANGDEFMVEITITDERFICNGNNTISNASTITLVEEIQATAQIQPIDPVCADSNIPVVITADGTYIDWRSEGLGTVYTWYINDVQVKQETLLGEASTANQLEIVPSELPADAVVRLQVSLPAEVSCVLPPADATYAIPFAEPTAPTVSLSSSAPAGACPGSTITFTASATNAGTNPRFIFTVDGAEVQTGTSSSFVLADPQNGQQVQVQVQVTDATGLCLSQTEATSDPVTVLVLTSEECVGNGFNCGVFGAELTGFVRPSCSERNGALYYQISGGAQPYFVRYTYAGEQVEQVVNASEFELAMERIPAGEVSIYLRDRNGNECSLATILEAEPSLEITFEKTADGDVQCYGENSGKARLTVAGGNAPYEYLLEGNDTWQTLNGNAIEFNNLPAGIVNILVRNNAADACPAAASVEILNLSQPIEISYTITQQANCNDNIGAFTLDNIAGGNPNAGFRVKLSSEDNWRAYTPGMEFTGLARGRHSLMIENGACEVIKSVVVPSPGLIALSEESRTITFSCENPSLRNGLFLKIDAVITEVAGPYVADIYMMNSQRTYTLIATDELFNSSGELYRFYLEQGYYRVEVRSQTREGCPEVQDFVIEGSEIPVPITFSASPMNIYCEGAIGGVLISELRGAAGHPYQVEVYQEGVLLTTRTISTFEYTTQQRWEVTGLEEGLYQVIIKQDQGLCNTIEQSQPAEVVVLETDQKLSATLMGTTVSFPERATGSLSFRIANGSGTSPYEASLVWIDRIEGQEDWSFESYGDPVPMNGTTGKYDYTYNNLPPGNYELTVTDANGCSVTLTETVGYDNSVFVPNFISPNGDGKNDLFHIRNKVPNTQLIITNRWGKVVYQSADYQNDWGGDALPEGLYYYSIKFPESENGELKGWLQIKRGAQPY